MWFNKARALQEAERSLAQGKLSQAIQQYLEIIENDPSDLALVNTAGDLCVRDHSIPEALKLFRKLADAYTRDGFLLRAIAIYRKILRLAPQDTEAMLKLGELYARQGLTREARDLYAQALAAFQQQNLQERAIEVIAKMVASDPSNVPQRLHLADCYRAVGRDAEALRSYLDAAEAALAQGDAETATAALGQASELESANDRVIALRRRLFPDAEASGVPAAQEGAPAATVVEEPLAAPLPAEAPKVEAEAAPGPAELRELDLSQEWEVWSAAHSAPEAVAPAFDYDEASAEVESYLEGGRGDDARRALERIAQQYPGNAQAEDLRHRYEDQINRVPAIPRGPRDTLRDLARELERTWSGPQPAPVDFAAALGALLDEAAAEPEPSSPAGDPQTHYELGVAFREMGLLDEAIGEFQSVVRGAISGPHPPEYLHACSLLALCFSEKQLPALAVMWYQRALETPGLDPDSALALHYDLGVALEQAGNLAAARDSFLQVYGYNIDYRDVADKVRQLSAKL